MNIGILLNNLIIEKREDSILYNAYSKTLVDVDNDRAGEKFTDCIDGIKSLTEISYDYSKLTEEAKKLGISRRDCKHLCDSICFILGNAISELCETNNIFVKSSNLEDYCPYPNKFVMYTIKPVDVNVTGKITYDNNIYNTVACSVEKSPYYEIWATLLED